MKRNKILKIFIAIILLISIQTVSIAATTGVVNKDTVRVRKEANTTSDIVELVSIGDKIIILGEENGWYKVKVNGEEGYIRQDLLTVEGEVTFEEEPTDEEETPTQPEEPNNGEVSNEETTNENPIVDEPNEGNTVTTEQNDKTISTIKTTSTLTAGQTIQIAENIKIKILPSANSSNIAELTANTEVTVLEVINNWCRVETGEHAGWVRIDQ